jgi:hypothetical protein
MPIAAIFDADDKLRMFIDGPEEQIALNVPDGGRFEVVTLERMMRQEPPPEEEPPP